MSSMCEIIFINNEF